MVIVDTSIWVSHLREGNRQLESLLLDGDVVCHPFIIGELACGNIRNRTEILSLMQTLPVTPKAQDDEVLFFIERHDLHGIGIGLVDVHLLASARLSKISLWTSDKKLRAAANRLNLSYK